MIFTYQGQPYELPDGLAEITLQQVQAWSLQYGYGIASAYMVTSNEKDPNLMRLAQSKLWMDYVTAALSFFSGIPIEQVRNTIDISDIVGVLSETQIAVALQGPRMPPPLVELQDGPTQITIAPPPDGNGPPPQPQTFELMPADQEIDWNTVTRETYVAILTLAGYALELINGDWSNFHVLVAGFVRLPGESVSLEIINPQGSRALNFQQALTMDYGAYWAQYFIQQAAAMLRVVDYYTTRELADDPDAPEPPDQVPAVTNFYVDPVAQPDGTRLVTSYWDVLDEVDMYTIEAAYLPDFSDAYVIAQGKINTHSFVSPPPPQTRYLRIKAHIDGRVDSEWTEASYSYV